MEVLQSYNSRWVQQDDSTEERQPLLQGEGGHQKYIEIELARHSPCGHPENWVPKILRRIR